jgi:hypothetical protein
MSELSALKHDLERYMTIANTECNRAEEYREELDRCVLTLEEMAKVLRSVDRPGCAAICEATVARVREVL